MKKTENEMVVAIPEMELKVDYEQFENLIVTALEGGIDYWGDFPTSVILEIREWSEKNNLKFEPFSIRFAKYIWSGNSVSVIDIEEIDDEIIGNLNLETITVGWQLFANHEEHFQNFLDDQWDATTADVWFQCCSLGDVVYG